MTRWLNQFQPWGIFLLRVVLGLAMLIHGYPKVIPTGGPFHIHSLSAALGHSAHAATLLGLPPWFGTLSALTEFLGGLLLILGLLTRFAAFLVTADLLTFLILADIHHGYAASEYPLALAAIAFLLLLTGPGKASLDRKLGLF
jgi:putative oxidoreductase